MRAVARAFFVSLVLISPSSANIGEPVPASVLVERCRSFILDPSSASGMLCDSYVRGFIAGRALDGTGASSADAVSRETFAERAARTRLGIRRQKPAYCLAEGLSMESLVERVLAFAESRELEGVTADRLLQRMLVVEFPCGR